MEVTISWAISESQVQSTGSLVLFLFLHNSGLENGQSRQLDCIALAIFSANQLI